MHQKTFDLIYTVPSKPNPSETDTHHPRPVFYFVNGAISLVALSCNRQLASAIVHERRAREMEM